mgnify:FL=1
MSESVIYEPRGAAREYAALAVNLYDGCPHGCKYCYAPACLHKTREAFHAAAAPRKGILSRLERDVEKLAGDERRVLLCFTCDPYPDCELEHGVTRRALEILDANHVDVSVLTKNGMVARRDFDLYQRNETEFGATICFADERLLDEWEPGAPSIASRMNAIASASRLGIQTWVSVEPVISPLQAWRVMELLRDHVDVWKVGKLNHMAIAGLAVDWQQFLAGTLELMDRRGMNYQIRDALWAHANDAIKARWPQATV